MKLIRKCALALLTVVLASSLVISCGGGDDDVDTSEPYKKIILGTGDPNAWPWEKPAGEKEDSDATSLHRMILPSGIESLEIPAWSVAADGVKDLPPVVTKFTTGNTNSTDKHKYLSGATNRTDELITAMDKANREGFFDDKPVKNVIVVFSDGWGETSITASRQYYNTSGYWKNRMVLDYMPYRAAIQHDSYAKRIDDKTPTWTYDAEKNKWWYFGNSTNNTAFVTTDSTAGGTAINTGFTTYYSACDCDLEGTEVKNILELAREKGMLVGNVTNDWLSDATPVTATVHSPKREDDVITYGRMYLASPDFSLGNGGFGDFIKNGFASEMSQSSGYDVEAPKTVWDGSAYVASSTEKVKGHLKQWYEANLPVLKTWAISMLNEYDGKTLTGSDYDFKNWTKDRNMQKIGLSEAIAASADVRSLVSLDLEHKFEYTPSAKVTAPKLGYKLGYDTKKGEQDFPNFAEMVASTLYVLDKKAQATNRGFFAFIENTCPDGWGHKSKKYDIMNETQISDEGLAIAIKYVLEHPDTLLVCTADHETGDVTLKSGWDTDYTKITSTSESHSSRPIPIAVFGAGAKANWGDIAAKDTSKWTADDWRGYANGTIYPKLSAWTNPHYAEAKENPEKFPKILRNRTTGIRIGKALGFDKFGDLNGNGILDPDTESDSIVSYDKVGSKKN